MTRDVEAAYAATAVGRDIGSQIVGLPAPRVVVRAGGPLALPGNDALMLALAEERASRKNPAFSGWSRAGFPAISANTVTAPRTQIAHVLVLDGRRWQ